jgi:methylmalonyl-CoA epimerase
MKAAYLDHIGIAVTPGSRLAEALAVLGLPVTGTEVVESENVDTAWVPLPVEQTHVELLQPTEPGTVIAKFLEKTGRDGIHHLSFRVEDIKVVSARLIAAGFLLTYPEPRPGAHHCLVNFIHPKTTGGVLVEITEKMKTEGLIS